MSNVLQISCTLFHYFPETAENFKKLCHSADIAFTIPSDPTCCGMPYFDKGDLKTAKKVAEYNLNVIGDQDIISSSLKCEQVYTVKYPKIFNNTVSHIQCMRIAGSAKGLHAVFEKARLNNPQIIQGNFFMLPDCDAPKKGQTQWLSKFPNAKFQFSSLENTCCGAGFCLPALNPETASGLSETILNEAINSGFDTIVASNDICMIQLMNVAKKKNLSVNIIHIIDLFARAL